jgi:hypothetical protein
MKELITLNTGDRLIFSRGIVFAKNTRINCNRFLSYEKKNNIVRIILKKGLIYDIEFNKDHEEINRILQELDDYFIKEPNHEKI